MNECSAIIQSIGFHCREVRDSLFFVGTPFTFGDGTTIGFYMRSSDGVVTITDNSDTLFHLFSLGIEPSRESVLSARVQPFGVHITSMGELRLQAQADHLQDAVARFVGAALAIVQYEDEHLHLTAQERTFVEEVEIMLKAWKPDANLETGPRIAGRSGQKHRFDFRLGSQLVSCAHPNGQLTGGLLRRCLDIQPLDGGKNDILVVMEDRKDPKRAKSEADILNTTGLVNILMASRLEELAGGATRH